MILIFLFVFPGIEKNHSAGENTVGTHHALQNMDKAIEPRFVSFQFPGAPFSMGSNPSLPRRRLPVPYRPPPSTTFQFILSCWLARFTTKFPLARRSCLRTLYLLLPLFCPLSPPEYLILLPHIFIFFPFGLIYRRLPRIICMLTPAKYSKY
jgi:hypothetical protein